MRGIPVQQILFSLGHDPITQVRRARFLTDVGDLPLGVIVIVVILVIALPSQASRCAVDHPCRGRGVHHDGAFACAFSAWGQVPFMGLVRFGTVLFAHVLHWIRLCVLKVSSPVPSSERRLAILPLLAKKKK